MAKHSAPQQCPEEPRTQKYKKSRKSKRSTPHRTSDAEDERQQQPAPVQPVASSSGYELTTTQPSTGPLEATAHGAVLGSAVQEAVSALIASNWNIEYAVATQALHRLSTAMALQIIDAVTTTAPVDINAWILARSLTALGTQPQSIAQPHTGLGPDGVPQRQKAHNPRPQLTSLQISKAICAFGRYPTSRPAGMTTDAEGRLSLANLMLVWGSAKGLREEKVRAALQQHGTTDKGQRFVTTTLHSDLYIEVSKATKDKALNTQHSRSRADRAIGAPRSPKRRKYR